MPVRPPLEIEAFRALVRLSIQIGGDEHRHHPVALLQFHALEVDILAHVARLGELHRRDEAQEFLDRQPGAAPVRRQPIAAIRILQQGKVAQKATA